MTCENISLPVNMGCLLPGVLGTMTDWLKIFQVGNRSQCHFYDILSISYVALCKKLSDTTDVNYSNFQLIVSSFSDTVL